MLPWFRSWHPVESYPVETTAIPRPREASFASRARLRRDAIHVCGSTLFCQIACLQRQNAGEIRNRRGEGLAIARSMVSAVSLVVYKVRQSGVILCKLLYGNKYLLNHRFTEAHQAAGY